MGRYSANASDAIKYGPLDSTKNRANVHNVDQFAGTGKTTDWHTIVVKLKALPQSMKSEPVNTDWLIFDERGRK